MNVLVTGGAGFVGTNLIKRLVSEGHNVVSVDNYFTGFKTNHVEGAKYVNEDISFRKRNWNPYLDNGETFDVVYHLAAIARIQPSFKNPVGYFQTNANGTLYIADFCVQNNIPLIYAGSSSHHSGKFKNPYTFSKDIGEEIIKLYQEHFNLKSSIARFYNVYGPHHLKDGGYCTLIGRWEKLLENNEPLTIYGDGEKRRDFTHIDDIVDGLIKIHEKEKWGFIFEFGRGKNYSILDIAKMFGGEITFLDDKPGEAQTTLCDSTLANIHLNWYPKINIEDYIKSYLDK
jgi:UDP-glucose 4-epimerase